MKASKTHKALFIFVMLILAAFLPALCSEVGVDNIDKSKWAWVEGAGWLNLSPDGYGVEVKGQHLEGFIWHENVGWIKLGIGGLSESEQYTNDSADSWGVNIDTATGKLSGYAWSETTGWINFAPCNNTSACTVDGVSLHIATVDGNEYQLFAGWAWSENLGYIKFNPSDTIHPSEALIDGFTAIASYYNKIVMNWTYPFDEEEYISGFMIRRKRIDSNNNSIEEEIKFSTSGYSSGDTVTYSDLSLLGGYYYTYEISAYDQNLYESQPIAMSDSDKIYIDLYPPDPAPANLSAYSLSNSRILVSWDNNTNDKVGFMIYKSTPSLDGGVFTQVATLTSGYGLDASFDREAVDGERISWADDSSFAEGTEYVYKVRAYNTNGNGDFSNVDSAYMTQGEVNTPTDLTATFFRNSSWTGKDGKACLDIRLVPEQGNVVVRWTDQSDNEYGYKIYRKRETETEYTNIYNLEYGIDENGVGSTVSWNDTTGGINGNVLYTYKVKAYNAEDESDFSNTDTMIIPTTVYYDGNGYECQVVDEDVPEGPLSVDAKAISDTEIQVSWIDNSDSESYFKIYRKIYTDSESPSAAYTFTSGIDTEGTGGSYSWIDTYSVDDPNPEKNVLYLYRVYSCNPAGSSSDYGEDTAKINTGTEGLVAPTLELSIDSSNLAVVITWTDNSTSEVGFEIYKDGEILKTVTSGINESGSGYTVSLNDKAVLEGHSYTYQVVAYNLDGRAESNIETVPISKFPLDPPISVDAYAISAKGYDGATDSSILLKWIDNSQSESGFKVYRAVEDGAFDLVYTYTGDLDSMGVGKEFSWLDYGEDLEDGLEIGVKYTYKVCSFNLGEITESQCSDTDTAAINVDSVAEPTNVDGYAFQTNPYGVLITWTDNSENETGFRIYRTKYGREYQGDWDLVKIFTEVDEAGSGDTLQWLDIGENIGGLESGVMFYTYKIKAYNMNDSAMSECEDVGLQLGAFGNDHIPGDFDAYALTQTQIGVSWTDTSPNESGFKIYRCEGDDCNVDDILNYEEQDQEQDDEDDDKEEVVIDIRDYGYVLVYTLTAGVNEDGNGYRLSWIDNGEIDSNGAVCDTSCLRRGVSYTYLAQAFNLKNESRYSNRDTTIITLGSSGKPTGPTDLEAYALSSKAIRLTWTDTSNNETGFQIFRNFSTGGTYTTPIYTLTEGVDETGSGQQMVWLDESAIELGYGKYFYAIRAYNINGHSKASNTDAAVLSIDLLDAPTDFDATAESKASIKLSWKDGSTNEMGFVIFRCDNGNCETGSDYQPIHTITEGIEELATGDAFEWHNTVTASEYPIELNHHYYYKVCSYNYGGNSPPSDVDNASISIEPIDGIPGSLSLEPASSSMTITWTDNSTNEIGFKVYRSDATASSFNLISNVTTGTDEKGTGGEVSFTDTSGLELGVTYYYKVVGYNLQYESSSSSIVRGQLSEENDRSAPATPVDLDLYGYNHGTNAIAIVVSWTDMSTNETLFFIYRKASGDLDFKEIGDAATLTKSTTGEICQFEDKEIEVDELYTYKVRAYNGSSGLYSEYSNTDEIKLDTSSFEASMSPDSLDASVISTEEVKLKWKDRSTMETGFAVYRSIGNDQNWEVYYSLTYGIDQAETGGTITWSDTDGNPDSTNDNFFDPETEYWYYIEAFNAQGEHSGKSNNTRAVIHTGEFLGDEKPSDLKASVNGANVTLTWYYVKPGNENGFNIYRTEQSVGEYVNVYSVQTGYSRASGDSGYSYTFVDSDLYPHKTYLYKVSAYNMLYESAFSNVASATTGKAERLVVAYPDDTVFRDDATGTKTAIVNFNESINLGIKDGTSVYWACEECPNCIDEDGVFTAPAYVEKFTIKATSKNNSSRTVTIYIGVPLFIDIDKTVWLLKKGEDATSAFLTAEGFTAMMNLGWSISNASVSDVEDYVLLSGSNETAIFKPTIYRETPASFRIRAHEPTFDKVLDGITNVMYTIPTRNLSGRLYNSLTSTAIPSVKVSLRGTSITELTRVNGRFDMNIPDIEESTSGKYYLDLECTGYLPLSLEISEDDHFIGNIYMQPASLIQSYIVSEDNNSSIAGAKIVGCYEENEEKVFVGPAISAGDGLYYLSCKDECSLFAWKEGYARDECTYGNTCNLDTNGNKAALSLDKTISFNMETDYDEDDLLFNALVASKYGEEDFSGSTDEFEAVMNNLGKDVIVNSGVLGSVTYESSNYKIIYQSDSDESEIGFKFTSNKDSLTRDALYYFEVGGDTYSSKVEEIDPYIGGEIEDLSGSVVCQFRPGFTNSDDVNKRISSFISYHNDEAEIKIIDEYGNDIEINEAFITMRCPVDVDIFSESTGIFYKELGSDRWVNGLKDKTITINAITPTSDYLGLYVFFSTTHLTRFKISYIETGSFLSDTSDIRSGCFIATAAYGDILDPNVQILSRFRDMYLMKNYVGRSLVEAYYRYSPGPAKIIAENRALRAAVRVVLTPAVLFSYAAVKTTGIQKFAIMLFIVAFTALLFLYTRRRV